MSNRKSSIMVPHSPREYAISPRMYTPRLSPEGIAARIPAELLAGDKRDMDDEEMQTALRTISLLKEYEYVQHLVPQSLYVLPAWNDPSIWHGVMFIRQGFYTNGVYRFRINVPEEYPEAPPIVTFTQPVHHPLIHPITGVLDLNTEFQEWSVKYNLLFVLIYIKRIFYNKKMFVSNPDAPDIECYEQFINDKRSFMANAELGAKISQEKKYDSEELCSLEFTEPVEGGNDPASRIAKKIEELAKNQPQHPAYAKDIFMRWIETDYIPSNFAEGSESGDSGGESSQARGTEVDTAR